MSHRKSTHGKLEFSKQGLLKLGFHPAKHLHCKQNTSKTKKLHQHSGTQEQK